MIFALPSAPSKLPAIRPRSRRRPRQSPFSKPFLRAVVGLHRACENNNTLRISIFQGFFCYFVNFSARKRTFYRFLRKSLISSGPNTYFWLQKRQHVSTGLPSLSRSSRSALERAASPALILSLLHVHSKATSEASRYFMSGSPMKRSIICAGENPSDRRNDISGKPAALCSR